VLLRQPLEQRQFAADVGELVRFANAFGLDAQDRPIATSPTAAGETATTAWTSNSPTCPLPRAGARRRARTHGADCVPAVRPVSGAPRREQPVEQPPRGAVGHRRLAGRLGGGDAILGEQQVDDFCRPFGAQFGR
jgi:hypothetical protein